MMLLCSGLNACPKCNEDFKKELLEKRVNTLGGQELLEAIKNQSSSEQSVNKPVNYTIDPRTNEYKKIEMSEEPVSDNNTLDSWTFLSISVRQWFIFHG